MLVNECGLVGQCARPLHHRGHHGGWRPVHDIESLPATRMSNTLLTPSETRITVLLAGGATWQEIAHDLRISRSTLSHHRSNAIAKYPPALSVVDLYRALGWLKVPA